MSDDRPGFFAAVPGCGCMACEFDRNTGPIPFRLKYSHTGDVSEKDRHALNPNRVTQPFEQIGKGTEETP